MGIALFVEREYSMAKKLVNKKPQKKTLGFFSSVSVRLRYAIG